MEREREKKRILENSSFCSLPPSESSQLPSECSLGKDCAEGMGPHLEVLKAISDSAQETCWGPLSGTRDSNQGGNQVHGRYLPTCAT